MKIVSKRTLALLLAVLLGGQLIRAQEAVLDYETNPDNEFCFSCHGHRWYTYANQDSSQVIRTRMFMDLVIDSVAFYHNNHKFFACTDCHSSDYNQLPHNPDLKLEPGLNCMDCHDDSDYLPGLNFGAITEEFEKSIHAKKPESMVSCWSCHNPHSYRITTRSDANLKEVVAYDNSICLECHSGMGKFDVLYGDPESNLLAKHKWLPNQLSHFKSVRCIECHTEIREDMLVAHNIRPKEEAVRNCAECHSSNSRLKYTLYKYQLEQETEEKGFFASLFSNRQFAVGANSNTMLQLISLILLAMVVGGITIHSLIRIFKK